MEVNAMRRVIFYSVIMFALLIFPGCTTKKKAGEKKTVIRFAAATFTLFDEIREKQANQFEKKFPNVDVVYQPVAGGFHQKIMTEIVGGNPPDVFICFGYGKLLEYVKKGILLDLTDYIKKDTEYKLEEQYESAIETLKVDGKVYGIPSNMGMNVLYYNKDHFDETGISYPTDEWTWDDIIQAAKKLTKRDKIGKTERYGIMIASNSYNDFLMFMKQFGGRFLNEDGTKCIVNSPESLEALKFLDSFGKVHKVAPTLTDMATETGSAVTFLANYEMFKKQRCSMIIDGRWLVLNLRPVKGLNYRFALIPKSKIWASSLGTAPWVVYKGTKHPDIVWEFVKLLGSREGQRLLVGLGDSLPTYKDFLESEDFLKDPEYPYEDNSIFLKTMPYTYTDVEFCSPFYNWEEVATKILTLQLDKFALGMQTAEETLKTIEDEVNRMIKEGMKQQDKG